MQSPLPLSCDIVLIGGGHAHALLLRQWGMDPLPGARLTLINPGPTAPYTGMLPGFVAGHYARDDLEIDLVKLAQFAGARVIFGAATAIDRQARLIYVPGRTPVGYDYASLDIGITSDMPELPGFSEHGIPAKPLGPFAARWQAHLDSGGGPALVIGGGVAGVELALAMHHAMGAGSEVRIVESDTALRGVAPDTARRLRDALDTAGISLIENATVREIGAGQVTLSDGQNLPSVLTVGAAGARPFDWLNDTGLSLENGFVAVGPKLQSINDPRIFAVGDCAHLTATPRPKAGVFAVRAAPILTGNLKAAAADRPLRSFRPQSRYLKLISLGGKSALADRDGRTFGGPWMWRWKDWIDRRFMDRLAVLPLMEQQKPPHMRAVGPENARPLCAGCGSKVGSDVLDRVVSRLPPTTRADVIIGPGADAAVLDVGGARQVLTTDHLRAFWHDPWLFGRIAAIHALGDIWAMGAKPQAVLAQITLPRMTPVLQERWLTEIMSAADDVFREEGAVIVGGHTTQGAEFTIGFSITGLPDPSFKLPGAQAQDQLILTRPIGSGTLFAAAMAGQARGVDLAHVLTSMATPQGEAARTLAQVAHALTDVTGFGVAGHAVRIARPADLGVEIDLAALPVYPGAETLAAKGVRSSIWQDNRDALTANGPETVRAALLFDPQTAGGCLAAVPETHSAQICAKICALGHEARIIGRLVPRNSVDLTFR